MYDWEYYWIAAFKQREENSTDKFYVERNGQASKGRFWERANMLLCIIISKSKGRKMWWAEWIEFYDPYVIMACKQVSFWFLHLSLLWSYLSTYWYISVYVYIQIYAILVFYQMINIRPTSISFMLLSVLPLCFVFFSIRTDVFYFFIFKEAFSA